MPWGKFFFSSSIVLRTFFESSRALAPGDWKMGSLQFSPSHSTITFTGASNAHVAEDRKKNAPVEWVAPGPVAVTSVVVALAARPSHPHAAMLMIDFLISEEGQTMYKQIGYNSARKGLEKAMTC